jgi:hypothetical protein
MCFCCLWTELTSFANGCRLMPEGSLILLRRYICPLYSWYPWWRGYVIATPYKLQFFCHPGGQTHKSRPRMDMGMSRLRRGCLRFRGEVRGEGSCCLHMEFIVLGVTSKQFRGGWAERFDRREVGCWLEVGGIEFGFWRLDLWVLMCHLCWHCFCYCCCCQSCCWE